MFDPCIQIIDDRFRKLVLGNAHVDKLWTGGRWTEGPAYFAAGKYLIWSDIPNNRVMRWDECSGAVSVLECPSRNQNGHTVDLQGRLVSCEHQARVVSRMEHDGSRTVLASHYNGKRFNSPNDVIVKNDDSIWFTDPTYGIDSEYEGDAAPSEIGSSNVYRIDPQDGSVTLIIDEMVQPNGLAFSPDESILYVADTGQTHVPSCTPVIRAYPMSADGKSVGAGKDLFSSDCGLFDGFRVDTKGNIWSSAGDGVHCYAPDGTRLGKILIPEVVSNICLGGIKKNRLFICGTTSLYAMYVNAEGSAR